MIDSPCPQADVDAGAGPVARLDARDPVTQAGQAFLTLLFNKYRARVYAYLRRRVSTPEDASDLLQECYFRLLRRGSLQEVDGLAVSYLFETAKNLLRDHARRQLVRRAHLHVPLDEIELESELQAPERALELGEMLEALSRAIATLPEPARSVFLLSRYRSLTHTEISERLGLSLRTVERRLAEALAKLARDIGSLL